jgi:tripartite-type tricarboxylate transporter receptor subunit TctC
MRVLARFFLIALPVLAPWLPAQAQDWPTKPVRIIVPYVASGASDIVSRRLAEKLSLQWGQPVIVDNRPGGATIAGTTFVARSAPDGYTMLITSESTMAINPHLFAKLPYDPRKDFAPVTALVQGQFVLTAPSALPANTLTELIALARAKPGTLSYGSLGVGNQTHLFMEIFKAGAGLDLVHIPYKGGAEAIVAVVGNHVQLVLASIQTVQPHIKAGVLKAIAIGGTQRSPLMPAVPTFAELGYPDVVASYGFGLYLPAGAPRWLITSIHRDVARVVSEPDFRDKQITSGFNPVASSPEQFTASLLKDDERFAKAVKLFSAKVEQGQEALTSPPRGKNSTGSGG